MYSNTEFKINLVVVQHDPSGAAQSLGAEMLALKFAIIGRLAVLTVCSALGVTFASPANADSVEVSFSQSLAGLHSAPISQQPSSSCDSNYSGACVPIASDVDCAGGSGNGPAYVQGPVTVVGNDIYGLDRDGDGRGCTS